MLTLKYIEDFFNRAGVDIDTSSSTKDETGDFISVVDSSTKFSQVKSGILKNPVLNKKVNSMGTNFIEIYDNTWFDGNKVGVALKVIKHSDSQGFGINIKAIVISVDTVINGQPKKFSSFGDLNTYIEEFKN